MNVHGLQKIGFVLVALLAPMALAVGAAPKGWFLAGTNPAAYETGVDRSVVHGGRASAVLRSRRASVTGFGTLMQTVRAERFRGKRLRYSGYVMADSVVDWAGLWMRVDSEEPKKTLAFDNMQRRPIRGSRGWARYEVVLDVAPHAARIAFGILLSGQGAVWLDDVSFEVVGKDVPTTDQWGMAVFHNPVNLEFEE